MQLDAPRHLYLHTNNSIAFLAAEHNMNVVNIVNDSDDFQFTGSEQYKLGIPLSGPKSYYQPLIKRITRTKTRFCSNSDLRSWRQLAKTLNEANKGDQRVFYLKKI